MDILKILKEKSAKNEALSIVYRGPDGSLKYYSVIPYLLESNFFQGLTKYGTYSFLISNVIAVQDKSYRRPVSWHKIKSEKKLIVLPGTGRAISYLDLTEEEKYILMKAIFAGKVIIVGDYIIVQQGER